MFKKTSLIIVLVMAIGIGVIFVRNSQPKTTESIKIGALLPSLTGDLVANREKMINGVELAKEDITAKYKGHITVDIDYEDGCFEKETVPAVQKFINNGVSIIGVSFCLFGHIPILPMTEGNKIITFNTAANPDVTLNLHYAFSTNIEIKDEAQKISEFAYTKLGARRAVIMYIDTPFGHDYSKYFTRNFTSRGGQMLMNFPNVPDGKEFGTTIAQIKALNPDVIITAHFGVPLGIFIREVRKAGVLVPIVGNYETEDLTVLEYASTAAEGVMFSSSELTEKTVAMKAFETRYVRKYGVEPGVIATNSYDDIHLAVESFLQCHGERDCMANKLHKIKDYQGASGNITIKPSGATDKPTIFKIIKNRTFIRYE